jgi:prephenate dehydrogenase
MPQAARNAKRETRNVFEQITIIGAGLIGGSLGLALKQRGFQGRVVGCDREPVLKLAREVGAIDVGISDPARSVAGSQVVVLATPVGAIIDLIERLGPVLGPNVLLTDVGSTKREIVARAGAVFGNDAPRRFLGGHPMAGKEHSGIEQADAGLFEGAVWLFTPQPGQDIRAGIAGEFLTLVERAGSEIISISLDQHDRLCAWISHLPQMLSTALAAEVHQEFGDDPELLAIGGRALREMTRIAASPYSMWRDIALTNSDNIHDVLQRLEQRLAHIRENLRTPELKAEFEAGNRFEQSPGSSKSPGPPQTRRARGSD